MRTPAVVAASVVVVVLALPAGAAPPPQQQIAQLKRQVATLKTQVKQLRNQKSDLVKASARSWRRELALRRYAATEGGCPVTRPNGSRPPAEPSGSEHSHGNGALWVGLQPSNVVVAEPQASGALWQKFGWFRAVTGALTVTGRRLDGPAPLLIADVPDGYGDSGWQATGIYFPTAGCWEVTGRARERA
jgi:outer membrane murein-binding lipoprotein Lpp